MHYNSFARRLVAAVRADAHVARRCLHTSRVVKARNGAAPAVIVPVRSALFVPGSNPRAIAKAQSEALDADAIILDLEDAVAPDAKEEARKAVEVAVNEGVWGKKRLIIRVNGIGTQWYEGDVATVAALAPRISAVMLPKTESSSQLSALSEGIPPTLPIWCVIETPKGVLCANEIASAADKVNLTAIAAGTSDLAKDLRAKHTPDRQPLFTSLSLILLAARAYGLMALDGVHLDLHDGEGLKSACAQGRAMGYDGKTVIHPSQIAAVHAAFSPTVEELAHARKVIDAHSAAVAAGNGVTVVDGRLVERLHVEEARRLLAFADALLPHLA